LGGIPLELIDTAGLREAADEAEAIGIRKSRETLADADLVLVVLDASTPLRQDERELIASLVGRRALVAQNKSDLSPLDIKFDGFNGPNNHATEVVSVKTSALTGDGIEQLRDALVKIVHNSGGESESGMLTSIRHYEAINTAIGALDKAREAIPARIPHE